MIASIDWVTLHDKVGFFLVVAAVAGAIVALVALVTPLVGTVLKLYVRLLLLAVAVQIVLGGVVYLTGHRPAHEIHYLYGAGVAVALGLDDRGEPAHSLAGLQAAGHRRRRRRGDPRRARPHVGLTASAPGPAGLPEAASGRARTTTTLNRERMRMSPASTGAPRTTTAMRLPAARNAS